MFDGLDGVSKQISGINEKLNGDIIPRRGRFMYLVSQHLRWLSCHISTNELVEITWFVLSYCFNNKHSFSGEKTLSQV